MDILCIFFIGLWWKLNFNFFHVSIVKFLNDFLNLTIILFFSIAYKISKYDFQRVFCFEICFSYHDNLFFIFKTILMIKKILILIK
jgi:hypothetical protein